MNSERQALIEAATRAAGNSRCPISGFQVGAALQVLNGPIVAGCNIENSTLSLAMCAERVALFNAISSGHVDFTELVIVAPKARQLCPPCGSCRQLIWEFAREARIVLVAPDGTQEELVITDLLPRPFDERYFS
ncbi:MAG: cytidine deaminase [Xanthomonadales bacterium]|nr:cytidine deaminase [Xanthomonadales bacterium]